MNSIALEPNLIRKVTATASRRRHTLPICLALLQGAAAAQLGAQEPQAAVYRSSGEALRLTSTPKGITLKTYRNASQPITVRAYLAELRLDRSTSSGFIGKGAESLYRKFVRLELSGISAERKPAKVEIYYAAKEADEIFEDTEVIPVQQAGPGLIVDAAGYVDATGTYVEESSLFSTKYRNFESKIIEVTVKVTSESGQTLFSGSWPDEPAPPVTAGVLPTAPRTFTNAHGQQIIAQVTGLNGNSVTVLSKGKSYTIQIDQLSLDDQVYLKELSNSL